MDKTILIAIETRESRVTKKEYSFEDWDDGLHYIHEMKSVQYATVRDFNHKSDQVALFNQRFGLGVDPILLKEVEIESLLRTDSLKQEFPAVLGGVMLSRIGYNRQRNQALVSAEYFDGLQAINVEFFIFEKKNDRWVCIDKINCGIGIYF